MTNTIKDLIAAGTIRLGMTRSDLRDCLGEPDAKSIGSRKYPVPAVWKYGDVEFSFPPARNVTQADAQGLLFVYIDDDGLGREFEWLLHETQHGRLAND